MSFNVATYNPRQSPIHDVDARVKIVLVLAYSVALFCVHTWWGLGVLALLVCAVAFAAHLNVGSAVRSLLPVGFVLAIMLLANSFVLDVASVDLSAAQNGISAGVFSEMPAIPLVGSFGFVPAGFARGCYLVLRIVLLLLASLVLTTTSTSTEITRALTYFLHPLERIGLPVHDFVTALSLAIRFIPVTIDQFDQIRTAQASRGAGFGTGSLLARLKAWASVFMPMFVGLFRRAENLAMAMDARCYGFRAPTQLAPQRVSAVQLFACAVSLAVFAMVGMLG